MAQLIGRQLAESESWELVASRDRYDLLIYRLSEMCHLSGLAQDLEGQLRRGWADIVAASGSKRATVASAVVLLGTMKQALAALGADPDDRALDPPGGRLARVREAALEIESDLRAKGVAAVYIFGSVARQQDGPDSDVDLAVDFVSPDAADGWGLGGILVRFQEILEVEVHLTELDSLSERMRDRIAPDLIRLL